MKDSEKEAETDEQLDADFKEFFDESPDRGIALSLPAIIENRIDAILKAYMRQDDTTAVNEYFQPNGPPFAAKVRLAYLLGLLGPDVFKDLRTIIKIRNEFAHRLAIKLFDQSP